MRIFCAFLIVIPFGIWAEEPEGSEAEPPSTSTSTYYQFFEAGLKELQVSPGDKKFFLQIPKSKHTRLADFEEAATHCSQIEIPQQKESGQEPPDESEDQPQQPIFSLEDVDLETQRIIFDCALTQLKEKEKEKKEIERLKVEQAKKGKRFDKKRLARLQALEAKHQHGALGEVFEQRQGAAGNAVGVASAQGATGSPGAAKPAKRKIQLFPGRPPERPQRDKPQGAAQAPPPKPVDKQARARELKIALLAGIAQNPALPKPIRKKALGAYFKATYQAAKAQGSVLPPDFYKAWLGSQTAPIGLRVTARELGIKGGRVRYFEVASVSTPDGKHKVPGIRQVLSNGSSIFASYGGSLTRQTARDTDGNNVTVTEEKKGKRRLRLIAVKGTDGHAISESQASFARNGALLSQVTTDHQTHQRTTLAGNGNVTVDNLDPQGQWAKQEGRFVEGKFQVTQITLPDGTKVKPKTQNITEIVTPKGGRLFQLSEGLVSGSSGNLTVEAQALATQVDSAQGGSTDRKAVSTWVAKRLKDLKGVQPKSASLSVEKDGSMVLVFEFPDGHKRVEKAAFGGASAGGTQALITYSAFDIDTKGNLQWGDATQKRWTEYLPNGEILVHETGGRIKGEAGVFTGITRETYGQVIRKKQNPDGTWTQVAVEKTEVFAEEQVIGSFLGESLTSAGRTIQKIPVASHMMEGLSIAGQKTRDFTVGGLMGLEASMLEGVDDEYRATYELESYASFAKVRCADIASQKCRKVAQETYYALSPRAQQEVDSKIKKLRAQKLKSQGITAQLSPEAYEAAMKRPVADSEMGEALAQSGAGTYGQQLREAGFTTAGTAFGITEGISGQLPMLIGTAGLGAIAQGQIGLGLTASQNVMRGAQITQTAFGITALPTFGGGTLEALGTIASTAGNLDSQDSVARLTQAAVDLGTNIPDFIVMAKGIRLPGRGKAKTTTTEASAIPGDEAPGKPSVPERPAIPPEVDAVPLLRVEVPNTEPATFQRFAAILERQGIKGVEVKVYGTEASIAIPKDVDRLTVAKALQEAGFGATPGSPSSQYLLDQRRAERHPEQHTATTHEAPAQTPEAAATHLPMPERLQRAADSYQQALDELKGYENQKGFLGYVPEDLQMPNQGVKLHVSASPEHAPLIAKIITKYLREKGVAHKVVGPDSFQQLLAECGNQCGKLITIYPRSPAEAKLLAREIDALLTEKGLTNKEQGLLPPHDLPIGESGYLTARYGRMSARHGQAIGRDGKPLVDRAGNLIKESSILYGEDGHPLLDADGYPVLDNRTDPRANFHAVAPELLESFTGERPTAPTRPSATLEPDDAMPLLRVEVPNTEPATFQRFAAILERQGIKGVEVKVYGAEASIAIPKGVDRVTVAKALQEAGFKATPGSPSGQYLLDQRRAERHPEQHTATTHEAPPVRFKGPEPILEPPPQAKVATVLGKIESGKPLGAADVEVLIQQAITESRQSFLKHQGSDSLNAECLRGACGLGQADIHRRMTHLASGEVEVFTHQTANLFPGQSSYRHAFVVVRFKDTGKVYLVDTTFRQFFQEGRTGPDEIGLPGKITREMPAGDRIADQVIEHGYIELTPDVAAAYSRGLSQGKLTAKPEDFTQRSTQEVDYSPDDLDEFLGPLPERETASSSQRGPTAGRKRVVTVDNNALRAYQLHVQKGYPVDLAIKKIFEDPDVEVHISPQAAREFHQSPEQFKAGDQKFWQDLSQKGRLVIDESQPTSPKAQAHEELATILKKARVSAEDASVLASAMVEGRSSLLTADARFARATGLLAYNPSAQKAIAAIARKHGLELAIPQIDLASSASQASTHSPRYQGTAIPEALKGNPELAHEFTQVTLDGDPAHTDPRRPSYHNRDHGNEVADTAHSLVERAQTQGERLGDQQRLLVELAARWHDVDPARTPGTSPSVARTLQWIDSNPKAQDLLKKLGLNPEQVKTLIKATDFDPRPGQNDRILQEFEAMVEANFSPDQRAWARQWGLRLRMADQTATYLDKPAIALQRVRGLAREIYEGMPKEAREKTSLRQVEEGLLRGSLEFIDSLQGQSWFQDNAHLLTPEQRQVLDNNRLKFAEFAPQQKTTVDEGDLPSAEELQQLGVTTP